MAGTFSGLNIAYSGLRASQLMVDTTGHNVANASTDGYTRQKVVLSNAKGINIAGGEIGQGVRTDFITRVHDEFIFQRYTKASSDLEYANKYKDILREVNTYFPDIDGVGMFADLQNYFDSWEKFAMNPDDASQNVALAEFTKTLTTNIRDTHSRLKDIQLKLNDELKVAVEEVNSLGAQIAKLNGEIKLKESSNAKANDLRDQRDQLELGLSKLLNVVVSKSNLGANATVDNKIADFNEDYNLTVSGFTIVANDVFHPFKLNNKESDEGFYKITYQTQDKKESDVTDNIDGGKIGAILDLRGRVVCSSKDGGLADGTIQNYLDSLDSFCATFIEATNNIYAQSATKSLVSKPLVLDSGTFLDATARISSANYSQDDSKFNFKNGTFDLIVYDNSGFEIGKKSVTIDSQTTINDIVSQINTPSDDNSDGNSLNDIDDMFLASYSNGIFQIIPKNPSDNFNIAMKDNGTNFPSTVGINRFFEGSGARDIDLLRDLKEYPSKINAYLVPILGDNQVANAMVQLQYEQLDFLSKDGVITKETISGFYRVVTSKVATEGESANSLSNTRQSVYSSVKIEQEAISSVNMDEEMTNLIKYQTGYQANAKVVNTLDKMLETLLGLKQ